MEERVGVKRVEGAGEGSREVDEVKGSTSVTRRMVKRGAMEMDGGVQWEVEKGVGTGWEADVKGRRDGGGVE